MQGSDLPANSTVEMARLEDAAGVPKAFLASQVQKWTRVPVLQAYADQSLKFVVPAEWQPGIFACRIVASGLESEAVLLNQPDPWWVQGDEGEAATPGGWLHIIGKCLGEMGTPGKDGPVTAQSRTQTGQRGVITLGGGG